MSLMSVEIVSTENVCEYESVVFFFSRMEMLKISHLVFQQTAYQDAKNPCSFSRFTIAEWPSSNLFARPILS